MSDFRPAPARRCSACPRTSCATGGCRSTRCGPAPGCAERQLHRRCLPAFGYGPKTLARVLRLDRALARSGAPFATVAVRTGFADQTYLAHDVRALAGVPLGALVRD